MIKSLFILNPSGNVVLEKHWRGATPRAAVEVFWVEVCKHARKVRSRRRRARAACLPNPPFSRALPFARLRSAPPQKDVPPVITTPKHYMVSIQRSGLFFLAIVIDEVPPLLVIELLDRMCRVFKIYFSSLSESVLISNFTTVYMLLEEMLDDGFPMTTEANALMDMIRPPSMFDRIAKAVSAKSSVNAKLGSGVTSQTPWRRSGVKYAQNEIYFDVTESIDCIVAANGQVVSCTVSGVINANCRLSGMPDLTMSFEKSSIMEDVSFHPCVRYSRWERDHVVSFVPPDGDFELMRCVRRRFCCAATHAHASLSLSLPLSLSLFRARARFLSLALALSLSRFPYIYALYIYSLSLSLSIHLLLLSLHLGASPTPPVPPLLHSRPLPQVHRGKLTAHIEYCAAVLQALRA